MTDRQREHINEFFVHVFNKILAYEERALEKTGFSDLSVRELHVLEAAQTLCGSGRNTMSGIAAMLSVSVGALTTAVNTLVRKGYLARESDPQDRRIIRVVLTDKGRQADAKHTQFHNQMIDSVGRELSDGELEVLTQSLDSLGHFFTQQIRREGDLNHEN